MTRPRPEWEPKWWSSLWCTDNRARAASLAFTVTGVRLIHSPRALESLQLSLGSSQNRSFIYYRDLVLALSRYQPTNLCLGWAMEVVAGRRSVGTSGVKTQERSRRHGKVIVSRGVTSVADVQTHTKEVYIIIIIMMMMMV